jgi:hypothetical protein
MLGQTGEKGKGGGMVAVGARNFIDIKDLDEPVYRTFSERWFVDLLNTRENGLRNPSTWDDPFENFLMARTLVDFGGEVISLRNLTEDWYGQCWTTKPDTDAMWRIYSPQKDGVQVKTTIRKLFDNLCQVPVFSASVQFFVGRVRYESQENIRCLLEELTFRDISSGGQGDGFARLLCVKREAFAHEHEVRLLYQDVEGQPGGRKGARQTVRYPLDPNVVFDQVLLDPRLGDADAAAMTNRLAAAGWRGAARKSTLYEVPAFTIRES